MDYTSNIKKRQAQLAVFNANGIPFASRHALNRTGWLTQKVAKGEIRNKMITRNKWSENSVRVAPTRSLNMGRQVVRVGSVQDYMATQEFGGTKTKKGKEGVRIATSYAAGQSRAKPRTRLPRGMNKIRRIQLTRASKKGVNRKQRNIIAIYEAAKAGRKFVFLDMGRRKGIFRITGRSKRSTKRKIRMVHDITRQSVRIPKNPWLEPSAKRSIRQLPKFYFDALGFQLKRAGLK